MLSELEKRHLLFILENPRLPILWKNCPEYDRQTLRGIIDKGLLIENYAFTMRGICHLVVDCQVPFTEVLKAFAPAFVPMRPEIDKARRVLETDDAFNIFYYYNFKQYLDWDLFNERNSWKKMEQKELLKVFVQIGLNLIDDSRIPYEKYFDLLGIPAGLLKDMPMSKEQARYVLQTTLSYL